MEKKLPRGISKRGQTYRVRISVNGKQEHIGDYLTLSDAKAALAIARADAARGIFQTAAEKRAARKEAEAAAAEAKARTMTVKQWSDRWLTGFALEVDDGRKSRATLREYASALKCYILPTIGDLPLSEVTPKDIDRMLAPAKRISANQEAKIVAVTRRLFNAAIEEGVGGLDTSPVKVKLKKRRLAPLQVDRIATPEEVARLAAAMPERLALSVLLAAWCQTRQGEALGLQRRDFTHLDTPDGALVRIERQWNQKAVPPTWTPTKAKDVRQLAIPAPLVPVIVDHLDRHVGPEPTAPVFPSSIDPTKPLSQTRHNLAWKQAKEKAGMRPDFRFHDLRHTGLTYYAQQGATLAEIMARGGHTDVQVAMRYQHAAAERDRQLAAQLPVQLPQMS